VPRSPALVTQEVSFESKTVFTTLKRDFRYTSENGLKWDIAGGPFRAISGLMHRSKMYFYSITTSARPISVLGTLMPSVLAVFRLMYSSTFVACWTGKLAGFSPLRIRPA
jgi:hypothetical protein